MILTYYSNDRDNILFQNFFNLDAIIPSMRAVYPEDHEIWQQDFIAFGECAFQIYLLVGVGEHNKDKIYAEAATEKVKLRFLCDSIFDFFRDYMNWFVKLYPKQTLSILDAVFVLFELALSYQYPDVVVGNYIPSPII